MKQKVALVLSGGGARGTAHIGVVEEILRQDFEISSVAGTSMGAVVGGVHALDELTAFKEWLCTLDKMKIFQMFDFNFGAQGLIKGEKVLNRMQEFMSDEMIENLRIPYTAMATDIVNRKEVVFDKGSLFKAIRASIAIPAVITPVKSDDGLLVDGGVLNNIPINKVARTDGDILIAVNVNANVPVLDLVLSKKQSEENKTIYQKRIKSFQDQLKKLHPLSHNEKLGYFHLVDKTIGLMMHKMVEAELENHKPDVLINVSRDICTAFDFYRSEELIEIGRQAARNSLEKYRGLER